MKAFEQGGHGEVCRPFFMSWLISLTPRRRPSSKSQKEQNRGNQLICKKLASLKRVLTAYQLRTLGVNLDFKTSIHPAKALDKRQSRRAVTDPDNQHTLAKTRENSRTRA